MTRATRLAGMFAVFCLCAVPPARAQTRAATSFEQLQVLVQPGDTVSVTDSTGTRASGTVRSLSRSLLEVDFGGMPRRFAESDVATIQQRRGDSLKNGALWGLGVGAGFAATALALLSGGDCYDTANCFGFAAAAIGVYGGIGAGIGTGVDAMIKGQQVVYQAPVSARLQIAPLVTRRSKGVQLAFGF